MNGKINEINNRLPTEKDLSTHLSTIFTENRLKKYIELRSMDTCGWDCLCAGPAFNVGMLYGNLDEVHDIILNWDKDKILMHTLKLLKKVSILSLWVKTFYIGHQPYLIYQEKV